MANSKRKCKQCGEYVPAEIGIKVPAGFFCSSDHDAKFAIKKAEAAREQLRQKANANKARKEKAARAKHRADKQRIKPLSKKKSEAQAAINAYVRIRDKNLPCISCGKPAAQVEAEQGWKPGGCWDAGHYISRGARENLRFNLWNIHKQCKSCNGGEINKAHTATVTQRYESNLREKIGDEKVDWLNNAHEITRFDSDYLERAKEIFRKKTRLYKRLFRKD